jgi:hypothetical protein
LDQPPQRPLAEQRRGTRTPRRPTGATLNSSPQLSQTR